jgi:hypothetical protein
MTRPEACTRAGVRVGLTALVLVSGATFADDRASVDFARDVRPILTARCIECHGPKTQESGLRLDHRVPALRGGDSGKAIVAGDSQNSELFRRISSADESLRMPPADGEHEPLSAAQIATIKSWIDSGAVWPDDGGAFRIDSDHWAYQPVSRDAPPALPDDEWSRNPLDPFVLAGLVEAGVSPARRCRRTSASSRPMDHRMRC